MKNKNIIALVILTSLIIVSCGTKKFLFKIEDDKQIDTRLVGIWEGSEKDNQILGMTKEWKMTRNSDGTFLLDFKVTIEDEIEKTTEEGSWWVKNGLFYELHTISGKTDIYKYQVLNENQVKFKINSFGIDFENSEYEFIDTRVNN